MRLVSKTFSELTTTELYEILRARSEIFVVEQNCAYQDIDCIDYRCRHIFYESDGRVAAYLRVFLREPERHIIQLGRVLTVEHGKGLGGKILKEGIRAAREMHGKMIYIEAQKYAAGYYEREGFRVCSEEFLEDGIPHVQMELAL